MINLVDLYYQINKNIFFTDKISSEAFTVYYNRQLSDVMWNYAAISNLSSIQKNYDKIEGIFSGLHKKIGFYLREDQKNDICRLLEHQILIKYPESWLRLEENKLEAGQKAQLVQSAQDKQSFLKILALTNQKYYQDMNAFLSIFQKTFGATHFSHFVLYQEHCPVGIAVLGRFKNYAVISHFQTLPEFSDSKYQNRLLQSCLEMFQQNQGKELYLQIVDNPALEKWALKQGFQKMFNSYLLSR